MKISYNEKITNTNLDSYFEIPLVLCPECGIELPMEQIITGYCKKCWRRLNAEQYTSDPHG